MSRKPKTLFQSHAAHKIRPEITANKMDIDHQVSSPDPKLCFDVKSAGQKQ